MARRTGQQRLDDIPAAIDRRDEFLARVGPAKGDLTRCADLMAEAIAMRVEANQLEVVGRDGKRTKTVEDVVADHCLIAARNAYLEARGSNSVKA